MNSPTFMIDRLVQSALQTGWLSVESEGLLRQMLTMRGIQSTDLEAIERLYEAMHKGLVRREAQVQSELPRPDVSYSVL
jgi:hypothetical protein